MTASADRAQGAQGAAELRRWLGRRALQLLADSNQCAADLQTHGPDEAAPLAIPGRDGSDQTGAVRLDQQVMMMLYGVDVVQSELSGVHGELLSWISRPSGPTVKNGVGDGLTAHGEIHSVVRSTVGRGGSAKDRDRLTSAEINGHRVTPFRSASVRADEPRSSSLSPGFDARPA
jgi:hypothetical protein